MTEYVPALARFSGPPFFGRTDLISAPAGVRVDRGPSQNGKPVDKSLPTGHNPCRSHGFHGGGPTPPPPGRGGVGRADRSRQEERRRNDGPDDRPDDRP